ncbi:hypothetical protein [Fischerella thermalis]|uniref:hypothetical protein n=1 Tax=Fischerella thermalis TaxID=372787 RepID=UPI0002D3533D|nr:hypothetical protein [Fischerella thermalis]
MSDGFMTGTQDTFADTSLSDTVTLRIFVTAIITEYLLLPKKIFLINEIRYRGKGGQGRQLIHTHYPLPITCYFCGNLTKITGADSFNCRKLAPLLDSSGR